MSGRLIRVILQALAASLVVATLHAAEADSDLVEAGRQIYEQGLLEDGTPLVALRPEGFRLEGEYAACVGCHRRSGMGSVEGNVGNTVLVPPIAGPLLFAGGRFSIVPLDPSHHYIPNAAWERALTRSAYDRATLARALRDGLDPDGRPLVSPMPRYDLDPRSLAALNAYLAQLTSERDPGVANDALHLATVITSDADPGHVEAVTRVLDEWSDFARGSGVPWQLQLWRLVGPAETWQAQLEDHYRRRPVFALLSGVGGTNWDPVHRYCELNRIPCILPSVEVTPAIEEDWYSVYYSPGVELESGILARYLQKELTSNDGNGQILQLYTDASGRHAATGLSHKLAAAATVSQRRFRQLSPRASLRGLEPDDPLVLWLRPAEIMQLAATFPQPPAERVYVSALLAPPSSLRLPPGWKLRVRFVSMFDDLGVQGEVARLRLERWLENAGQDGIAHRRLQADAYAAGNLFNDALGAIRKQEIRRPPVHLNREHLVETLEKLVYKYGDSTAQVEIESHVAWYGRMSLGPRQRVAVRGGSLLRYASADSNRLIAHSTRIVP